MTTYGHHRHVNNQPGPGFGEVVDIDLDALPTTSEPGNWPIPNVYIDPDTGQISRIPGRQLYLDPDSGIVYRSTAPDPNYPSSP
ncbi:hypothetical protein AHiyo4_07640 [Arthrobacter sp. Hiyo4]|nr:hypothetical protein AHiyo4_07640 [Arthrobacter sp. Hiyo4]